MKENCFYYTADRYGVVSHGRSWLIGMITASRQGWVALDEGEFGRREQAEERAVNLAIKDLNEAIKLTFGVSDLGECLDEGSARSLLAKNGASIQDIVNFIADRRHQEVGGPGF